MIQSKTYVPDSHANTAEVAQLIGHVLRETDVIHAQHEESAREQIEKAITEIHQTVAKMQADGEEIGDIDAAIARTRDQIYARVIEQQKKHRSKYPDTRTQVNLVKHLGMRSREIHQRRN